jgi:hypothetical protein
LAIGGIRAMRQQDAKLALAHGTVSQLGFFMVLLGLGTPAATYAGVAMLLAHALFKASLFLSVGVIDHEAGTRDLRRLRGLARALPVVARIGRRRCGVDGGDPMPTFGFVAKEKALDGLLDNEIGAIGTIALDRHRAGLGADGRLHDPDHRRPARRRRSWRRERRCRRRSGRFGPRSHRPVGGTPSAGLAARCTGAAGVAVAPVRVRRRRGGRLAGGGDDVARPGDLVEVPRAVARHQRGAARLARASSRPA